ncbi:hypothetical protein P9112_007588 [Eukaryota sp. TZLM1-RC]
MDFSDKELDACLSLLSKILAVSNFDKSQLDGSYLISVLHAVAPNQFSTNLKEEQLSSAIELYYEMLGKQVSLNRIASSSLLLLPWVIAIAVQSPQKEQVIEMIMEQPLDVQESLMHAIQSTESHTISIASPYSESFSTVGTGSWFGQIKASPSLSLSVDSVSEKKPLIGSPTAMSPCLNGRGLETSNQAPVNQKMMEDDLKRINQENLDLRSKLEHLEQELHKNRTCLVKKDQLIANLQQTIKNKELRNSKLNDQCQELPYMQNQLSALRNELEITKSSCSAKDDKIRHLNLQIEQFQTASEEGGCVQCPSLLERIAQLEGELSRLSVEVDKAMVTADDTVRESPQDFDLYDVINSTSRGDLLNFVRKLELYIVRRFVLFKYLDKDKMKEAVFEVIPILVKCLNPISKSNSVTKASANAIVSLALNNFEFRESFLSNNAVDSLLLHLPNNEGRVERQYQVTEAVLWALWSLLHSPNTSLLSQYKPVEAVLRALHATLPCNPSVIRAACKTFSVTLEVNAEVYWDDVSPDVVSELFMELLKDHSVNAHVLAALCTVLIKLLKAKPISMQQSLRKLSLKSLLEHLVISLGPQQEDIIQIRPEVKRALDKINCLMGFL